MSGREIVEILDRMDAAAGAIGELLKDYTPLPAENGDGRGAATPQWDSDSLTLRYGETVCRQYKRRNAANQFAILDAFHAAGWARSVDSPFGLNDQTLGETVYELNAGLSKESPIKFAVERRRPAWIPRVAPACSG
jgi:hypothetical protein